MADIDDKALALARSFLATGEQSNQIVFSVSGTGRGESIVITLTRTPHEEKIRVLKRLAEETISFQSPGGQCPRCGGTGRM